MNALAGIDIVEWGAGPAIAYAGKLLADLGADVIRIEPREGAARVDGKPNALALYMNARKQSAAIDAASDTGRAALRDRFSRSRILLYAANERRLAEWGLTPETIARDFPDLIVVAVTPFGLTGEARDWPADDLTLQAIGGVSIGIGLPGRAPLKLPGDQSAFQAGLAAAIAGAAALHARSGVLIDVSAAAVWASFYTGVEVAMAHFGRHKKRRAGQRVFGQPYPRTLLRCKDGYFAIQCGESRHWQGLLRMIEREDLATNALFANRFKANDEHGDACDALVEPWFRDRTKNEILQQCLEHKIPGAPVYTIEEVVAHPQLEERGYFVTVIHGNKRVRLAGHPFPGLAINPLGSGLRRNDVQFSVVRRNDVHRPLAGLRVVDFGWVWAGAVPGHILADMGAEVIKVESARPLDYMRQGRPIVGAQKDPEQNPMFHNVNRGKLSLRINLDRPEARAVLKDLVAESDVVIENFSPGVMAKFGLGYAQLKAVRPDVVMCSMSAAGQTGPLRGIRTYATMIASLAGLDSFVGYAGERVLGSQSSYADPNASLHATLAILAALWRRDNTGEGAYIDFSQWEAAVNVMGEQVADYALCGPSSSTCGVSHATKAPYGNYPAAGDDQWIAIAVDSDMQWQGLKHALGDPQWMGLEKFLTTAARHANRCELDERLADETGKHEAETLASVLLAAGVPAAPLLDASGVSSHPLFKERGLFETVEHPVLGAVPVYRLPWHVNGTPVPITRRAPMLGEHNEYALQTVLGYSRERVSFLNQAEVFQ